MLRVLHFSPHFEDCGIAKYQENYLEEMNKLDDVQNDFFDYSPYQTREMNEVEFSEVIKKLQQAVTKYEFLHIQHEFGFFRGNQLQQIVDTAKNAGLKVLVTYHTSPDLIIIKKPLSGLGPRSILSFLRSYRQNYLLSKTHITPLLSSDLALVHNSYTQDQLTRRYGVPGNKVALLPHPTPAITNPPKTADIQKVLNKQKGDVIISCVGYLHRFKGVDKAIKALSYLPKNYKLAVLGGVKADSDDQAIYDQLTDLILARNLQDRVYITGVVDSDEVLNSYIRETDVCAYPYDSSYYKGVASGAINLAIANERPIVAYPVATFKETNTPFEQIVFTGSDSYYELAKKIENLDTNVQTKRVQEYANANSWKNLSAKLVDIYRSV